MLSSLDQNNIKLLEISMGQNFIKSFYPEWLYDRHIDENITVFNLTDVNGCEICRA